MPAEILKRKGKYIRFHKSTYHRFKQTNHEVPCGRIPLIIGFCPLFPDPLFAAKFRREPRVGIDNPTPELKVLPIEPPPTIFPIELCIPKMGETPSPITFGDREE